MSKTGRNEPCPCGSGKKYKKCCMNQAAVANAEFAEHIDDQSFDSLEDVQAQANNFFQQRNSQAIDDFQGLSSEQMHGLLHAGFDSLELIRYSASMAGDIIAPVLLLTNDIIQAIDDKGLKLTAKGNLPRQLCQDAAMRFKVQYSDDDRLAFTSVNKEEDFFELHITHILLQEAGLIRKAKGRIFLTQKCQKIIGLEKQIDGLYALLFQVYCQKFNWAYRDGYPELHFLQQSALFTLYLLSRFGDQWRPVDFYVQRYIQAFPMVLEEMGDESYSTPSERLGHCYSFRVLKGFLQYMGLAEVKPEKPTAGFGREYKIRALPLLEKFVQWPHLSVAQLH